jgi:hypothetical protein
MIIGQTLFILGAGAHVPYGMPDGNKLTLEIIEELPNRLPNVQAGAVLDSKIFHDVFYCPYSANRRPLNTHRLVTFRKAVACVNLKCRYVSQWLSELTLTEIDSRG